MTGDLEKGRQTFRDALTVMEDYRKSGGHVPYYADYTDALTEMNWAGAALGQKQCAEAKDHMTRAAERAAALAPGMNTESMEQQLALAQRMVVASCGG